MINWHWLYRDFILASRNSSNATEWAIHIDENYFELHECLLNSIYFVPKGLETRKARLHRLRALGYVRYETMLCRIGIDFKGFETQLRATTNVLLEKLGCSDVDQEVYVIVGLDSTNIYTTEFDGSPVTVLCIEATDGEFHKLQLLLAHECHHWRRQQNTQHNIFDSSIGERMVSEGLASYFSQEIQPGRSVADYCYVPQSTLEWVEENWRVFYALSSEDLHNTDLMSVLFSRTPNGQLISGMPPRTGYVYGFLRIRDFVERSGRNTVNLACVPWDVILATETHGEVVSERGSKAPCCSFSSRP